MNVPKIAPLLSGQTIGSINDGFVIAEWRDPGGHTGPPRLIATFHVHHACGIRDFCTAQHAPYLLESRAGSGPVPAYHDVEYLPPHYGDPRNAGPKYCRTSGCLQEIRFRTAGGVA